MKSTYVPVTENGKQVTLETNAPIPTIDTAFCSTDSFSQLIEYIQSRGYYAGRAQYGLTLNYDQK